MGSKRVIYTKHDDVFDELITSIPLPYRGNIKSILYSRKYKTHKYYNSENELTHKRCGECFNVNSINQFKLSRTGLKIVEKLDGSSLYDLKCLDCEGENIDVGFLGCSRCKKSLPLDQFKLDGKVKFSNKGFSNVCDPCYTNYKLERKTRVYTSSDKEFKPLLKTIPKPNRTDIDIIKVTNTSRKLYYKKSKSVERLVYQSCKECLNTLTIDQYNQHSNRNYSPSCIKCEVISKPKFKYTKGMDLRKIKGDISREELWNNDELFEDLFYKIELETTGSKPRTYKKIVRKVVTEFNIPWSRFYSCVSHGNLHGNDKFYSKYHKIKDENIEKNDEIRYQLFLDLIKQHEGGVWKLWEGDWKKIHDISGSEYEKWRKDPNKLKQINKLRTDLKLDKHSVNVPDELKKKVRYLTDFNRVLLDVNKNVIFKYCRGCDKHLPSNHFRKHTKNKDGLGLYCNDCTYRRKGIKVEKDGLRIRGDYRSGILIRKRNSKGNIIERRCNSCNEFKPMKVFTSHKNRSICEECYVDLPNNNITRPREFQMVGGKKVQMRWYNKTTFRLDKKRCGQCKESIVVEEFYTSKRIWDGYVRICKSCSKVNRKKYE